MFSPTLLLYDRTICLRTIICESVSWKPSVDIPNFLAIRDVDHHQLSLDLISQEKQGFQFDFVKLKSWGPKGK